jgi:hypothetical protein
MIAIRAFDKGNVKIPLPSKNNFVSNQQRPIRCHFISYFAASVTACVPSFSQSITFITQPSPVSVIISPSG